MNTYIHTCIHINVKDISLNEASSELIIYKILKLPYICALVEKSANNLIFTLSKAYIYFTSKLNNI